MILVYTNTDNGLSKASKEVVTYAKKLGDSVTVVTNGNASSDALAELGQYGASKVLVDRSVSTDDVQQVIDLVASAAESTGATSIIFSHDWLIQFVNGLFLLTYNTHFPKSCTLGHIKNDRYYPFLYAK